MRKRIPELNQLVAENQDRNNVLFLSLAMDTKQDLLDFLQRKQFNYAVVPEMKNYMTDTLNVTEYPTHIHVDRKGIIVKVVNRIEDLVPFLQKEIRKNAL